MKSRVLIVGAGPTGLTLALFLAHQGVEARIVDRAPGPGLASRAMAVQARTLEFYRQIGIEKAVIERGITIDQFHLFDGGHEVARIHFGDLGESISPFPFALSLPQDEHERLLAAALLDKGVEIEWHTELISLSQEEQGIRAVLRKADRSSEEMDCAYLCGCDGAHSTVRQCLGLGFPGGTYTTRMFVADAPTPGMSENHEFRGVLNDPKFLARFPIRTSGMSRFIGVLPDHLNDREDIAYEDVRPTIEHALQMETGDANWFSLYKVHHRVASHFRIGRAFLCGDSGHIHSPAGGQGMNTGIGDSVNLAWKLAAVLQGHASEEVLNTYEPERLRFAKGLVASTDRVFSAVSDEALVGKIVREWIFPHVVPLFMGLSPVRTAAFKLLSQTSLNYRECPLSVGHAGHVRGGDRLPWVPCDRSDNFDSLRSLDWQVHCYGEQEATEIPVSLPVHRFEWSEAAEQAGLARNGLYLIRPDGYVAWAGDASQLGDLREFVERFVIRIRTSSSARIASS